MPKPSDTVTFFTMGEPNGFPDNYHSQNSLVFRTMTPDWGSYVKTRCEALPEKGFLGVSIRLEDLIDGLERILADLKGRF